MSRMNPPRDYPPQAILNSVLCILGISTDRILTHCDHVAQCVAIHRNCFENETEYLERYLQILEPVCTDGVEHRVYRDRMADLAIKVTKKDKYGHSAFNGPQNATPLEYLKRLAMHNKYFASDLRLLGCTADNQILSSQPWIERVASGPDLAQEKITDYMRQRKLFESALPTEYYGGLLYTNAPEEPVLAFLDVNPKNVWLSRDNVVVPLDIVIGELTPNRRRALLEERAGG